jgi:hypothetical protein
MAKFFSTTFGRISGKHGSAVASHRNGVSILKVFTPPTDSRSKNQLMQRQKFGLVANSLSPLRPIIYQGYGSKEAFAKAFSWALRNAITGIYPDLTLDYSKVMLSTGTLAQSAAFSCVKGAANQVSITWDATVYGNTDGNDPVNLVFYNPVQRTPIFIQGSFIRSTGKADINMPPLWAGASIHCWMFFTSVNATNASMSQYIGKITL